VLIDTFVEEITVLSDYLDLKVHRAPPLQAERSDETLRLIIDRVPAAHRTLVRALLQEHPF
jgi:hypothetical protein